MAIENQEQPSRVGAMIEFCTGFAKHMLEKSGEFYPIAAIINDEGKVAARAVAMEQEHPSVEEAIRAYVNALEEDLLSARAVATALAVNVNIPLAFAAPFRDGIRVDLKTPTESLLIYVPYQIKRSGFFGTKRMVELCRPVGTGVQTRH